MAAAADIMRADFGLVVADGARALAGAWSRGLAPPEPLTVSEWADKYRWLSGKGASEPGKWRTDRVPFSREIMDCLSADHPCIKVIFMKSTQVAGTEILNNWIGETIDHSPAPMMIVQPTLAMAARWSKQRFTPMVEETARLGEKLAPARSRDATNTIFEKEFAGGILFISGANSAASLRSMPIKKLGLDEVDAYDNDIDDEGHPVDLAERRTSTFPRKKIFEVSSPLLKQTSRIARDYDKGDQREFYVPCPHCDAMQTLVMEQLTDAGQYLCIECGEFIEEHHRTAMLAAGEWRARFPERSFSIVSFYINALYTPIGLGDSWPDIAARRAEARTDPIKEKVFRNTFEGLPYEDETGKLEPEELAARAEKYCLRSIPPGALILTAGVDVQHNRFAVQITGWGRGEHAWLIDYVELPADPTRKEDWQILDDYLAQPLVNRFGHPMSLVTVAVDSGNWTHEVYNYCRPRQARGIFAVKGMSTGKRPIIGRPSAKDVRTTGRTLKRGIQLWPVGTDTAKNTLFTRMQHDSRYADQADAEQRHIHFAQDLPADYYDMLCAERLEVTSGRWMKIPGRRNEAIDTFVYSYAAACHPRVRVHTKREADWAKLEAQLEPPTGDLFAEGDPPRQPVAAPGGKIEKVLDLTPDNTDPVGFGSPGWNL